MHSIKWWHCRSVEDNPLTLHLADTAPTPIQHLVGRHARSSAAAERRQWSMTMGWDHGSDCVAWQNLRSRFGCCMVNLPEPWTQIPSRYTTRTMVSNTAMLHCAVSLGSLWTRYTTDVRPIEWSPWCVKMTEPMEMLVWRHPRHDWFTDMNHGHVMTKGHNRELCKNGWTNRVARQTRAMSFQTRCRYSIYPHAV